jgi:myo-inositol 2-dehydrogenase/D-chiro-inositol 1-dehydrogenase
MTRKHTIRLGRPAAKLDRRAMLAGTAALTFSVAKPQWVRGAEANSKIALGLIGCGGRGNWIAELFRKHGRYQLVAAADYFRDRVEALGKRFAVEAPRRYSGLSGYRRLLEGKLDAVAIESPPYFHPEHAAAAVQSGRHVYLAKPIAVDVPGCLAIARAGKKATAQKQCFLVDFQTRANPIYQEAVRRVHQGAVGPLVSGEAVYYCGTTWGSGAELASDPANPELRLRYWGVDRTLSGDIITEQNIHALDVACWIIDREPVSAVGTGGRKARTGPGNCYDHFAVIYQFPGDVVLGFNSKQYGTGYDDIGCRMFGPEGMIDTHYFGSVSIQGNKPYAGGPMNNLFTEGAVRNIAEFHDNITHGRWANPTVAQAVRSNLTTILGRTAAYRRSHVTWQEILKADEKWEFDLKGLKV